MNGPILFVLGTKIKHDGIHMHIILSCNAIKDGRLVAILDCKKSRCWTRPQPFLNHLPMLFKLGTQITNDGFTYYARLFFIFFEIRSKMADWRPFCYLNVSPTISQTYMVRFCSNLAPAQYMMAYTCTSLYFAIWSKMADWWTGGHFSCKNNPMLNTSSTISRTCIYQCCSNLSHR